MVKVGSTVYCIYSGDVNNSNNINFADVSLVYNDATTFTTGYVKTDVTGDGVVNLADINRGLLIFS